MILGDVEETIFEKSSTGELKESKREKEMLFVRGDVVILISPPTTSAS